MNNRVAKLLRNVFNPSESQEKRKQYRMFKTAYTKASDNTKKDVLKQAIKIKQVRQKGGEVKTFKVNPETHQMEGENHEHIDTTKRNASSTRSRKSNH